MMDGWMDGWMDGRTDGRLMLLAVPYSRCYLSVPASMASFRLLHL